MNPKAVSVWAISIKQAALASGMVSAGKTAA